MALPIIKNSNIYSASDNAMYPTFYCLYNSKYIRTLERQFEHGEQAYELAKIINADLESGPIHARVYCLENCDI